MRAFLRINFNGQQRMAIKRSLNLSNDRVQLRVGQSVWNTKFSKLDLHESNSSLPDTTKVRTLSRDEVSVYNGFSCHLGSLSL